MKQLVQHMGTGKTSLLEVPVPLLKKGYVLIKTRKSLVSAGTERMLIKFSKANFLTKARLRPEKLKLIFDKIKTDGVLSTTRTVLRRLDQQLPLGYCNVGEIIGIGEGVEGFRLGDRVVSNGPHAEVVSAPVNLVAKVPDNVPDDDAAFTVLGAVALHGIRLLGPEMGHKVAVFGLGIIGLMAVDLLKAMECQVIAIEPDALRRNLAGAIGIATADPKSDDVSKWVLGNHGEMDGVLIMASSKSNTIISQAAAICRKRGKIVLTGSVGLHLNRADFYSKELTFQVSCSYGPGRYDPAYEERGIDYPAAYVRWTENRNFKEVLRQLSNGNLNVKSLITSIVSLTEYDRIYQHADGSVATLIDYDAKSIREKRTIQCGNLVSSRQKVVAALIGAGNFARMTLLPALKGKHLKYIVSTGGISATGLAMQYHIPFASADYREVLKDEEVNLVMIATRHDDHSGIVIDAMRAGKHVFVEKPLAITPGELASVEEAWTRHTTKLSLTVGFNRRFSPYITKMRDLLAGAPMHVAITVNAGQLSGDSWVQDVTRSGGRIIGEACHFMDIISFITGSLVTEVCGNALHINHEAGFENVSLLLKCRNGSAGVINYLANGSSVYPKERIEVHSLGRTLVLDDFRALRGYGFKNFTRFSAGHQKGHREQFDALFEMVESGSGPLMSFASIVNTTRTTFAALESLQCNSWVKVP